MPRSRTPWIVCLLLVAATLLVYAQTWRHGFVVVDDGTYIYENPWVRQGLTTSGVGWAFTTFRASNWHPLTWLSHMLDVTLFGMNAGGHHLVGAGLHALAAVLLFLFLHRATGSVWRSGFVAAVFALHPLRVESVAWAAERKDQLAALFFTATLLAWVRHVREPSAGRYATVLAMLTLGLLSKPMLVTLPAVLLLLDHWPLDRTALGWRRRIVEKLPLILLCGASAVVTVLAQSAGGAVRSVEGYPLLVRLANAAVSCLVYLGQTVWPSGLAVHYAHGKSASAMAVPAAVALAAVTLGLARFARRRPFLPVGWLWYLVMLLPVIGIVQVGSQARADRYTYLPSIGIYVMVAWGVSAAIGRTRRGRAVAAVAAIAVVVACAIASAVQVGYWRDGLSLFARAVRVEPDNPFSRLNYGVALLDAGRDEEAEHQLRAALELRPGDPRVWFNLGNLQRQRGETVRAESSYRKSLGFDPDFHDAHLNLGLILLERGDRARALEHFCRAERLAPSSVAAKVNCANALVLEGEGGRAESMYEAALALDPDDVGARLGLAGRRLESGRGEEGLALLGRLLAEHPDLAAAHLLKGLELERRGDREGAEACYREVLRLDPANGTARRRLQRSASPGG